MSDVLLSVQNLKKYFPTAAGELHAVDGVSFDIRRGRTLGVVGESGCGKSTLGRTVLRLIEPTSGRVLFEGADVGAMSRREFMHRRRDMQIIFQDPYASLNPRLTVYQIIQEPLLVNRLYRLGDREMERKISRVMDITGVAERYVNAYPHELDGGRRQRVGIARALVLDPKFIVCDEPVSALDVSIQAQILNMMMDLQDEMGLTYMFITHDLSVVKHISDDIAVMYLGQLIEKAPSEELFSSPIHPYTKALLKAVPVPELGYKDTDEEAIRGEVSTPVNPKPGCRFAPRCPMCTPACREQDPPLTEVSPGHFAACINYAGQPSREKGT